MTKMGKLVCHMMCMIPHKKISIFLLNQTCTSHVGWTNIVKTCLNILERILKIQGYPNDRTPQSHVQCKYQLKTCMAIF